MSDQSEKQPTDVLRTKRLEIVDDEGKVRASLLVGRGLLRRQL